MVLGPERGAVLASVMDGFRVFVPIATAPHWCAVFGEDFASQLNTVAVPPDWNIEHAYPTPEDVAAPSTKVFSAALLGYTASVTIVAGGAAAAVATAAAAPLASASASASASNEPAICLSESMVAALETLAEQRAQAAASRIDADVQERTRRLVKQLEEEAEKEKQSVRERELMPLHTLRARKRARVEIVEID
jgi:gas vesicle protein